MAAPFKDQITAETLRPVAHAIAAVRPGFDPQGWLDEATLGFAALGLKDRVSQAADRLRPRLDPDLPRALDELVAALPPPMEGTTGFHPAFPWWVLCSVVERHGLAAPGPSLAALKQMTSRWSAEFAVRPFLAEDPVGTLATLTGWLQDPDVHVRRWISEGTRPRLPWGQQLPAFVADPQLTAPILDALRKDPEPYVRRSVANHLGDVAKDHVDWAVARATRWMQEDPSPETAWVLRHGLRHPVKQGHAGALALLGFVEAPITVRAFEVSPAIALGQSLEISAEIACDAPMMVDLVLRARRADGSLGRKVFKWTTVQPDGSGAWSGRKRLPLRAVSTRRHHAGSQVLALQVNGQILEEQAFDLSIPDESP